MTMMDDFANALMLEAARDLGDIVGARIPVRMMRELKYETGSDTQLRSLFGIPLFLATDRITISFDHIAKMDDPEKFKFRAVDWGINPDGTCTVKLEREKYDKPWEHKG
jgi:hypothetical protein